MLALETNKEEKKNNETNDHLGVQTVSRKLRNPVRSRAPPRTQVLAVSLPVRVPSLFNLENR